VGIFDAEVSMSIFNIWETAKTTFGQNFVAPDHGAPTKPAENRLFVQINPDIGRNAFTATDVVNLWPTRQSVNNAPLDYIVKRLRTLRIEPRQVYDDITRQPKPDVLAVYFPAYHNPKEIATQLRRLCSVHDVTAEYSTLAAATRTPAVQLTRAAAINYPRATL
jgi:hypothetical protein